MADDPLTAELAEIAARARQVLARRGLVGGLLAINAARGDVPRLVKALEAVLKLADDFGSGDTWVGLYDRQAAGRALRDAIAGELTGKAADGG